MDIEEVFRENQHAVYRYFLGTTGSRDDAAELAQETFVRACSAALRFRGTSSVRTWLFGIARRVLLEASRRGLFDRKVEVEEHHLEQADATEGVVVRDVLQRLRPIDREVLTLVDALGFNSRSAAQIIGVDPSALRVRLHRARRRFRDAYVEER